MFCLAIHYTKQEANRFREPDSRPYLKRRPPKAIKLCYKKRKLGYVPHGKNEQLALMAFYGHKGVFEARVLQVDPEADPSRQVCVGVYVTDKR